MGHARRTAAVGRMGAARAYAAMALLTLATVWALLSFARFAWPGEVLAAAVGGCLLASVPGGLACGLPPRRRGWILPASVLAALSMALSTSAGWGWWFSGHAANWDAPLHLATLIAVPVLFGMQSAWFCIAYSGSAAEGAPRRRRLLVWSAVPVLAVLGMLPALGLSTLWWGLAGG